MLSNFNKALLSANDLESISELRQLKQAVDEMINEKLEAKHRIDCFRYRSQKQWEGNDNV